jgi:hypothetical protein
MTPTAWLCVGLTAGFPIGVFAGLGWGYLAGLRRRIEQDRGPNVVDLYP